MHAQIAMVMAMVALEVSALSVVITSRIIFCSLLDGKRMCDAKHEGHAHALILKQIQSIPIKIYTCLRKYICLG